MAAEIPAPVRRFLDKANVAVLSTRSARGLQATPVWFMYTDGHILINTAKGRTKLRNMQAHPEVALTVVNPENPYQYVQIQGKVVAFDTESAPKTSTGSPSGIWGSRTRIREAIGRRTA